MALPARAKKRESLPLLRSLRRSSVNGGPTPLGKLVRTIGGGEPPHGWEGTVECSLEESKNRMQRTWIMGGFCRWSVIANCLPVGSNGQTVGLTERSWMPTNRRWSNGLALGANGAVVGSNERSAGAYGAVVGANGGAVGIHGRIAEADDSAVTHYSIGW